ncbi:hypothetical protein CVS40_6659 [Lucilia cuprina]|nr:hypothetical protein CVS40_6659 [Lucilia cuprina]
MLYSKTCRYKNHKCKQCDRVGYKDGYCNVKNNNKQRHSTNRQQSATTHKQQTNSNKRSAQTRAIDNSTDNCFHRKHVNVLLNNYNNYMASDITIISELIWANINSPKLTSTKRIAKDVNHNKIEFIAGTDFFK